MRVFLVKHARGWAWFAGACLAAAVGAGPAEAQLAQCDRGDKEVMRTPEGVFCLPAKQVKPYETFCSARRTVGADQNAIKALNFSASIETFEYLENLSREQKAELQKKLLTEALGVAKSASLAAVEKASKLNPWNVNTEINKLRKLGIDSQPMFGAMRAIARERGKPAMAQAYADFLEEIEKLEDANDFADAAGGDNKALALALFALQLVQGNPYGELATTAAEFAESIAWLHYLGREIDATTVQTEDQLKALDKAIKRMRADMAKLRAARNAWQAGGGGSADPPCKGL